MKVVFTNVLSDGQCPLKTPKGEPMDLRFVCVQVLHGGLPNEQLEFKDHVVRYELGNKILNNDELDLDSDEISLLKKCLAKGFSAPAVVGQACLLLEGKNVRND